MSKRLLLVGLIVLALGSRALADTLEAQVFPLTGEVRFHNPSGAAVPFIYYSITSLSNHAGALNPMSPQWQSISDNYDLSGNGFIDLTHDWTKFPSTSIALTEGVFSPPGTGGSLIALRTFSLGPIWNPAVVPYTDIGFSILQDGGVPVTVTVQPAVAGDYNHDGTVDQMDYTTWRQNFGSTTVLDADGNLNGVVDAADYPIWRKNFGNSLPGAGSSIGGGQSLGLFTSAVPEPTSGALIWPAGSAFLLRARRRRAV